MKKLTTSLLLFALTTLGCLAPSAASAVPLRLDYSMTYDGLTATLTNHANSEVSLPFMPLVGAELDVFFAIAPGGSITMDALGDISGDFDPLDVKHDPGILGKKKKATVIITAHEDGVTWKDKTAGTSGTLDLSEQKSFPKSNVVTVKGSHQKGDDYEETTPGTTATWNPASIPVALRVPGAGDLDFGELVLGSLSSINDDHTDIGVIYNTLLAAGSMTTVPEPAGSLLMVCAAGTLLLLCRGRRRRPAARRS